MLVKNTHEEMLSGLMSMLNEEEIAMGQRIIDYLTELDYVPQKETVRDYVLSFKNKKVNQMIAKIGMGSGQSKGVFYRIKFYACKNPPLKFTNAVRDAILKTNKQYICADCGICGAAEGERGYHYTYPDGTEFIRCGSYVVEIPGLTPEDVDDFNRLLKEQHEYFLARQK